MKEKQRLKKINILLTELADLLKEEGATGIYRTIRGKRYVSFEISKTKDKCKECGAEK